jgi:hypothetical protein
MRYGLDARGRHAEFLAIDSAEAIAQNHPAYEASEVPAGASGMQTARKNQRSFSHPRGAQSVSEATIAAFTGDVRDQQTLKMAYACRQDRDAGHRQGRHDPRTSGRRRPVDGEEKTSVAGDYISED